MDTPLVPSTLLTGFLEEASWKAELEIGIPQTLFLTFLFLKKKKALLRLQFIFHETHLFCNVHFIPIKKTKIQNQALGDLGFKRAEEAPGYVGSKVTVMRKPKMRLGKARCPAWMGRWRGRG